MIALLLALQTVPTPAPPPTAITTPATVKINVEKRYADCVALSRSSPDKGLLSATEWRVNGGGYLAQQCIGIAYANQARWADAGKAFDTAAIDADTAKDARADDFRAQAGNAWLAAGDPAKARAALDAAIASNRLQGPVLGEARVDRARALVASGDASGARADLDEAAGLVPADPLVWLLSATLARREHNLPRATKDIAEALRLSSDDPSVQLEAGNIAALNGDEPGARSAWQKVITLAPSGPLAASARDALAQFGPEK